MLGKSFQAMDDDVPRGIHIVGIEVVANNVDVANCQPCNEENNRGIEESREHFAEVDGDVLAVGDDSHCCYLPL